MITISNINEVAKYAGDFKAFIFDLDDTLYSEKEYIRSGFNEVVKLVPYINDALEQLWKLFEKRRNVIDEFLLNNGIFSEELKQKCLSSYRNQKDPDIHFYDGVKELLTDLGKTGHFIGIITDGRPEGQWAKINKLHLKDYVDAIIVTDELGGIQYRKPNTAAFIRMKELSKVDYSESCYIGDNINKDFIAPEKLGMKYILFKNQDGVYFNSNYGFFPSSK